MLGGPSRVSRSELENIRLTTAKNTRRDTTAAMRYQQRVDNDFLQAGVGFAETADITFGEDLSLEEKMARARNRLGSVNTGLVL